MSTKGFRGKNMTTFSGFRGVDFSSSPLDVDARRASEMENFISDFGILRKRNGWRQEREFTDEEGNRLPVCGIFSYKNGETVHVLIHAGDRFLRLTENGYERIGKELEGLCATRSEAYMQKGRMYIVGCGDYLVYGTWDEGETYELRRVYDGEDTYIPVTTINIGSTDSDTSATLDDVNLLTPRRKNRLNGAVVFEKSTGSEYDPVDYYVSAAYHPDAPIEFLSRVTIRLLRSGEEIVFEGGEQDEPFYNSLGARAGYRHIDADGTLRLIFDRAEDMPTGSFELVSNSNTYTCSNGKIDRYTTNYGTYSTEGGVLTFFINDTDNFGSTLTVAGYTVSYPCVQKNGWYTLDYLTSSIKVYGEADLHVGLKDVEYGDGEDVFEVTFQAAEVEEEGVVPYSERIKSCSFGTLFGVDGASDRLFLAGNPRLMNTEFYSEADDFTYFPDVNTVQIGSDDVPTVGHLRLSDGTLAVFKEKRDVGGDATIYYRTSYYKQYTAADGSLERIDAVFPTVAGNSGEAMLSHRTAQDFGGDKLFLSENGLFGVVVSENIAVNERYTRERSRAVNARLTREKNLSDAISVIYKDKLYLAVNGNVYVADARYRSTRADSMDGAWGYEWYFLSNVPANTFAVVDGVLWFGTKDGRLCRFDGEYSDRTYSLFGEGEITLADKREDGFFHAFTVNVQRDPAFAAGDTFTTTDELFSVVLDEFSGVEGTRIYHSDVEALARLAEGERVRLCRTGASLPESDVYEVRDVDLYEGCFSLYKEGVPMAFESADFSLLRALGGLSLDVLAAEGSSVVLGLYGEPLRLLGGARLTGKLWRCAPVCARWVSAVTDLGTSMVGKSLHRLSITCEPTVHGRVTFGYNTRMSSLRRSAGGGGVFSLDALDFRSFSFETGFASSYSARIFERQVNYLALAVESNEDAACAFNRLELLWSFGGYLSGTK